MYICMYVYCYISFFLRFFVTKISINDLLRKKCKYRPYLLYIIFLTVVLLHLQINRIMPEAVYCGLHVLSIYTTSKVGLCFANKLFMKFKIALHLTYIFYMKWIFLRGNTAQKYRYFLKIGCNQIRDPPLMNKIRGKYALLPLNMPLMNFEIVCFCLWWKKLFLGHKGHTQKLLSFWLK